MEQSKEYYAFISYKREDEKWAKWLQHKLEHYKFPTNLNGRTDLPKNIRPTFRDVTDLKPGLLAEEINNALLNSEWLIVVCSPRSAKSPWVCKEAQTYIDLGRADHIIPFVIEGNPFSNDTATECYPEALLNLTGSKELLAANINEMGRDAAAIKVVARMFNLRFDALWRRYEREKRRKLWMWVFASILIALLGLFIGGYFVRQNSIIESQNERLQQDSLTMANHLLQISAQNDSIALRNNLIISQRDSIERSIKQLQLSNSLLAEERNNVLKANWDLKLSNARILSENAVSLLNEGNLVGAKNAISQICSDENIIELVQIPEVEFSLRKVYRELTREGIKPSFCLDNIGDISFVKFDKTGSKLYVVSNDSLITEYNAYMGTINAVYQLYPEIDDNSEYIQIYAFDEIRGNVYYSIDNTAFVKNVYSNTYNRPSIQFSADIEDMMVSPSFDNMVCEIEREIKPNYDTEREWHIIKLLDTEPNDFIIPMCNNIYCISPDGKKVIADIDGNHCIYNLNTKSVENSIVYNHTIESAHFSADGSNIFIVREDDYPTRSVDIYNVASDAFVEFGSRITGDILSICELKENPRQNRIIVGDWYGHLNVYETDVLPYYNPIKDKMRVGAHFVEMLNGHSERIESIEFNANGTKMLSVSNGKVSVWDVVIQDMHEKLFTRLNYISNSGKAYIKINNGIAQLYDVLNNRAIGKPLFEQTDGYYDFKSRYRIKHISRNSELVVVTKDSLVYVLWPNKNQYFTIPFGCYEYSLELSVDQEGKKLAMWDDFNGNKKHSSLKIYDLNSKTLLAQDDSILYCSSIAISPKGEEIAISKDRDIFIIYANTLVRKSTLSPMHTDFIPNLCYSPDGKYIVSASWDRTVCMWNAQNGSWVKTFRGAERELLSCSMSYDGNYVLATSKDDNNKKKTIYIWNTKSGEIVEQFKSEGELFFCQDISNKMFSNLGGVNNHFLDFPSVVELVSFFNGIK